MRFGIEWHALQQCRQTRIFPGEHRPSRRAGTEPLRRVSVQVMQAKESQQKYVIPYRVIRLPGLSLFEGRVKLGGAIAYSVDAVVRLVSSSPHPAGRQAWEGYRARFAPQLGMPSWIQERGDVCVELVSDFVFAALGCRAEQLGWQTGSRGPVPRIFG